MDKYSIRGGYRDPSVDVLKGLAIIFVVYGHTWPFCREFIYLFHMAVFMMASGYCYTANIQKFSDWKTYLAKKLRGLYIPFVICNGCFTLLSGFFLHIGLYTNDPEFLVHTTGWQLAQTLYQYTGVVGVGKQLIKVLLFIGTTQLGTATWFLTSLFFVLAVHSCIELLLYKMKENYKQIAFGVILFIVLILAQVISDIRPSLIFVIKCFPCTYAAFLMGWFVRKIKWENLYSYWMGLISLVALICLSKFFCIEVSAGKIQNIIVFIISSLCGWIFLKSLSELLIRTGKLRNVFQYIGRHTMPILCLHVLAFKIVSWLYIQVLNLPKVLLASFHVIMNTGEMWKMAYLIVGIVVPLSLYFLYDKIKQIIFTKDN